MATGKDDLFSLIRSLSKSEKGYFKKFNSMHIVGEQNSYIRLFDEMEKMKDYDERKIKEKFAGTNLAKNLAVVKNYLFSQLLRSLESYHSDENSELRSLLNRSEILYQKNQTHQAIRHLAKAKVLALRTEKFGHMMDVFALERVLTIDRKQSEGLSYTLAQQDVEMRDMLNKLDNQMQLHVVEEEIFRLGRVLSISRKERDNKPLRELLKHPLLQGEDCALSMRARITYFSSMGALHFYLQDYARSLEFSYHLITVLEQSTELHFDFVNQLLSVLYNHCLASMRYGWKEEARTMLAKLKTVETRHEAQRARQFQMSYNIEMNLAFEVGDWDECVLIGQRFEKEMPEHEYEMADLFKLVIFYQMASVYFTIGKHGDALTWTNRIINSDLLKVREDFGCLTRVIDLFIHFELGNYRLIDYKIESARKFINKTGKIFQSERIIFSEMHKLALVRDKREQPEIFRSFKEQMERVLQEPEEQHLLRYLDVPVWIESKLTGTPVTVLLAKKRKRQEARQAKEKVLKTAAAPPKPAAKKVADKKKAPAKSAKAKKKK